MFAELSNLGANPCAVGALLSDLCSRLCAMVTKLREDQSRECSAHNESGNDFSTHQSA